MPEKIGFQAVRQALQQGRSWSKTTTHTRGPEGSQEEAPPAFPISGIYCSPPLAPDVHHVMSALVLSPCN
jgi:hypothetical protein